LTAKRHTFVPRPLSGLRLRPALSSNREGGRPERGFVHSADPPLAFPSLLQRLHFSPSFLSSLRPSRFSQHLIPWPVNFPSSEPAISGSWRTLMRGRPL